MISDFAYADFCYDGYMAPSFLSTPGALSVGVEMTSMSKSYSMAGGESDSAAATPKWFAH